MIEPDIYSRYRKNIGICLFNVDGRVWTGTRMGDFAAAGHEAGAHRLQFPQGGIDPGEQPVDAAFRELFEETGVRSARLLTITPGWIAYDFPESYRHKKKKDWKGQRQKWAAMLFEGEDAEIDLQSHGEQEFSDWHWGELEDMREAIVPFKQGVYRDVIRAFLPLRDFIRRR